MQITKEQKRKVKNNVWRDLVQHLDQQMIHGVECVIVLQQDKRHAADGKTILEGLQ